MLQTISWYIPFFFTASLLILTGCFGDWGNWRKYYPTILFIVLVCLFAYALTYDQPLWLYHGIFLSPNDNE
ncbi:hypothetical protein [Salipaludibacillus neizhouensis]|uniref:hypothetical protein n=1 Tax=Salipaludibacillus neizhouensis TaxID=885475 RepID=UPI001CBA60C7|nr:hypothetical protein [Salipaludibacillus neizhouensis]